MPKTKPIVSIEKVVAYAIINQPVSIIQLFPVIKNVVQKLEKKYVK